MGKKKSAFLTIKTTAWDAIALKATRENHAVSDHIQNQLGVQQKQVNRMYFVLAILVWQQKSVLISTLRPILNFTKCGRRGGPVD